MTLKRDTEEQALEQNIIDNNLTTSTDKQEEMIQSMFEFLQSVQDTKSSDEYVQLVSHCLLLVRTRMSNKVCETVQGAKMHVDVVCDDW